ncbi:restriction endonuclease subunit S [Aeromonas caviae]|uniref:restriction endonuclease subunit S n=1 Tax=Aeromonas caviae TaxID=648 RepID=UPI0029D4D16E|nr:restriction endonuclease subunit S [Aeromonas caviae]MDX7763288.1 restriction endonuclease subunit S [Aeromonas caviae]
MSQLPKGWVETNFEDVSDYIQRGKGPKYVEFSEYPVVNQKAVRWFGIQEEHLKYVHPEQWDKWDELRHIREGDILWNSTGTGTIGRACHIDQTQLSKAKVVDSHITIVRTNKLVESRFAFYWIMHPEIQGNINGLYNGSTNQVELSKKIVESTRFPLAPIAEQTRIVKKLDEVLAKVEATQARLARIPDIIKQFRQSVLAAAVSGKLTAEWLVTQSSLTEVAEFQNGFAFKSEWFEKTGKYQVIKLGNIRDGFLALDNSPAYVSTTVAKEFSKFTPSTGDTLLSMTGTRLKKDYGFGCLIINEKNLLINQRVGRFIPNRKVVLPAYLNIFVRSDEFRSQFFEGETGGVNQGNVGSKHIMSIRISLPSIETQTEIVRRVEQLFAYADTIEQQTKAAKERVDKLTQAILAKAFRGELTADWRAANPDLISGDNSAAALLARIQAERATVKPRKSRRV